MRRWPRRGSRASPSDSSGDRLHDGTSADSRGVVCTSRELFRGQAGKSAGFYRVFLGGASIGAASWRRGVGLEELFVLTRCLGSMIPALLDPEPFSRVDERLLRETLVFAFATGDVGDALEKVVEHMPLAASSWDAKDFARDVFLDVVADRCFPILIQGKTAPRSRSLLSRILGAPPSDPAVVHFRQNICRELSERPDLRKGTEKLYCELIHLRALLSKASATRIDPFERRLAVLRALRDTARIAATEFATAKSGLATLAMWGNEVEATEGYARLVELLAYEHKTAEVDVRLHIGFDGKVRDLSILERREPKDNAFHQGPAARFAAKFGLFLRGYDFSVHELFARLADEVFEGVIDGFIHVFALIG